VIRPLADAIPHPDGTETDSATPEETVRQMNVFGSRQRRDKLRSLPGAEPAFPGATAGLQHLTCLLADDPDTMAARVRELVEFKPAAVQIKSQRTALSGHQPEALTDWWVSRSRLPQMALCRCAPSR